MKKRGRQINSKNSVIVIFVLTEMYQISLGIGCSHYLHITNGLNTTTVMNYRVNNGDGELRLTLKLTVYMRILRSPRYE